MHVSPLDFLGLCIVITLVALLVSNQLRRSRERALAELARSARMHYSRVDVFNLAPRIASHLPIHGAADVNVSDLIYGSVPAGYRYVFLTEYTVGAVRARRRLRRVLAVHEPRDYVEWPPGGAPGSAASSPTITFAPDSIQSIAEQYRVLLQQMNDGGATGENSPAVASPSSSASGA